VARGWESKSVESQIESAESDMASVRKEHLTPAQIESARKKESLLLSRTRILRELQTSRNPRYRALLGEELAFLDAQLKQGD
jgi:hypothetical protein